VKWQTPLADQAPGQLTGAEEKPVTESQRNQRLYDAYLRGWRSSTSNFYGYEAYQRLQPITLRRFHG